MRKGLLLLPFLTLLSSPASADATVTIGPDLAVITPGGSFNCGAMHECTLSNSNSPTGAFGYGSPVTGTVTSFRLRTGGAGATAVTPRVLRRDAAGFTGVGAAPPVSAPGGTITSIPANLPIKIEEVIGLDCCQFANDSVTGTYGGSLLIWGVPLSSVGPLAQGETRFYNAQQPGSLLMLNAEVEPSNDLTVEGRPKLKGKRLRVKATVPNFGRLTVAGARRGLIKRKTFEVSTGESTLRVKLAPAALARLNEQGRLKLKLDLEYTPDYGTRGVTKVRGKLKR